MQNLKLSVAIPYKQRLDNIQIAFEALAQQTMDPSEFEVVVGAMEYCEAYLAACRAFEQRLQIVSVLSSRPFEIPRARNLAMRQASGAIVVQMDADTLLPPQALQNIYRHFAFGQNVCVVGQVLGYGNNKDGDVESVQAQSYAHHREALEELARTRGAPRDPRFQVDHVIPWAFGWTGLIALPMATVRKHDLYFDETFRGWGVDDLEWSYRIAASGTPIVLREDVYALHLPHVRDMGANRRAESKNFRRFLRKWPGPDVELAHAFGDFDANGLYLEFQKELCAAAGGDGRGLAAIRGTIAGADTLVLGAATEVGGRIVDRALLASFDDRSGLEILPLVGLGLPYEDKSVDECRMLPSLSRFTARYREALQRETERVSRKVVLPARGDA